MPSDAVARLMSAKSAHVDAWQKTIRNAIRAAQRDGVTRYVGFTNYIYTISTNANDGAAYRFQCDANGNVWSASQSTN